MAATALVDFASWIGAVLTALGAALLLVWSLYWDRSRGRRRCSRCWYDLSGATGRTCPECGNVAPTERALFRTRRRWRWTLVALALLAASPAIWQIPEARARGWWSMLPREAIIILLPKADADSGRAGRWEALYRQARSRLLKDDFDLRPLWPWERWLLDTSCRDAITNPGCAEGTRKLAATLLVQLRPDAIESVPPGDRAIVILARSALAYARCTTYRDRGMARGSIGERDERPFLTVFDRGGKFRYEFLDLSGPRGWDRRDPRYVIWNDGQGLRSWWTIQPQVQPHNSIEIAVAGPTGISRGSSYRIPMLLTRNPVNEFAGQTRGKLTGTRELAGHDCFVISASGRLGATTLFIDSSTFALRRIDEVGQYFLSTAYDPEFDVPVDPAEFAFNPSKPDATPLADGESTCRAFRPLVFDPATAKDAP